MSSVNQPSKFFKFLRSKRKFLISLVLVLIFILNSFSFYTNSQPIQNPLNELSFDSVTYFKPVHLFNELRIDSYNNSLYFINQLNNSIVKMNLSSDYKTVLNSENLPIVQKKINGTSSEVEDFTTNGSINYLAESIYSTVNRSIPTKFKIFELNQPFANNNSFVITSQLNFSCSIPSEFLSNNSYCGISSIASVGNLLYILKGYSPGLDLGKDFFTSFSLVAFDTTTNKSISEYLFSFHQQGELYYISKFDSNQLLIMYLTDQNHQIFSTGPQAGYLLFNVHTHVMKPFLDLAKVPEVKLNYLQGLFVSVFSNLVFEGNNCLEFFESTGNGQYLINYALFTLKPTFHYNDSSLNIEIYALVVIVTIFVYTYDSLKKLIKKII